MSSIEAPRRTRRTIGVYRGASRGRATQAAPSPLLSAPLLRYRLPRAAPQHRTAAAERTPRTIRAVISNLDALAPLGAGRFFADHYEARPLRLAGSGTLRDRILTHEGLLRAIEGTARLAAHGRGAAKGLVLFAEQTGTTAAELVADEAAMRAYLEAGHPLVWNRARGVSPAVDALAALLAEAFGARVWPNVYATGTAGTPFDVHFDAHEVIAIQCEGRRNGGCRRCAWIGRWTRPRWRRRSRRPCGCAATRRPRARSAMHGAPGRPRVHPARPVPQRARGRRPVTARDVRDPAAERVRAGAGDRARAARRSAAPRAASAARGAIPDGAKTSALLAEVAGRARAAFGREEVLAGPMRRGRAGEDRARRRLAVS